ncbi:cytochrome P450 [Coleofasciculus sp. LEGE 07081]|uniref:cytochrome P450 n=1 Tax=unclassified Coleofasciculus TaxID=2692782 RepID=UPI001881D4F4|nr:cytochrome P450 [Coleofasciculus sp. LEGE 07081]MBE9151062.1 cytochrome P450 [Coleofasciculus sp. LEGE 07092]
MKIPDGPKTPPWLQKIQWTVDSLSFMDAAVQRYGDIFNAPVIGNTNTVLLVSNPQALQQIFSSDTQQFIAPANQLLQPLVGDYSMFVLEGVRHRRERKLLMPPFHGERMHSYGQLIIDLTEKKLAQLIPNQTFTARSVMQDISMEVILKVVFGLADGESFHQLKQRITSRTDAFKVPYLAGLLFFPGLQKDLGSKSPWGYIRHLQRQIDELLYAEIQQRREHHDPSRPDILSLLLSARDEAGEGMTDVELHDELITLLLAGHETTATAIAWALYWVHRFPEVRETMLRELETLGDNPDPLSIVRLPYLTAVCNETLRIYPVAVLTTPRAVKEPVELMGYLLEPGMRLYGCIYLTHRREDIYPNPQQFKPERFLERQFSPYEFLPFGGGIRRCIGEALALFEMKLVLATIMQRYELALADKNPERPKRRGATFAPERGVKMVKRR